MAEEGTSTPLRTGGKSLGDGRGWINVIFRLIVTGRVGGQHCLGFLGTVMDLRSYGAGLKQEC